MKFHRQRDQRRALIKSLADSLILNESLKTSLPKAKAVVSYTEKLITKAKTTNLASRRQVIQALASKEAAHKLVEELTPKLTARNSGYFRISKSALRRGDATQLAEVKFVDDLRKIKPAKQEQTASPGKSKAEKAADITAKKAKTPTKAKAKVRS
ncbi:50S ribosomal protein L17 [Candidatus Saccharibacteria bacterium RIFCSPHIGHO2_12_FULL_47_16b]|nr:MAG: 50S ribosomal protein L17 [Candidatus Saccharibacteria bacterium RIFCSPHIGHO2_12_FULL_47_16b]